MKNGCLITGASGGIGSALAREAAADGMNLVLSARDSSRLESLANELRAKGIEVACLAADLTQPGAAARLWREATTGREITMLINNAGRGVHGSIGDPALHQQQHATVALSVTAATDLMLCAIADMVPAGRGRILNVSSAAAFMPGPGMAGYHASKAYLLSLSEAASVDLADSGVTVTALCPGPTETGFFDTANMRGALSLRFLPKSTPRAVARAGWRGAMRGRRMVVPGLLYKVFGFSVRFLPRGLVLWVTRIYWRK